MELDVINHVLRINPCQLRNNDALMHKCSLCHVEFSRRWSLARHNKNVHKKTFENYEVEKRKKDEKKYFCNYQNCDAKFNRPFKLKTHISLHDGIKNFSCEFCEKSFTSNEHLKRHTNTLHFEKKTKSFSFWCPHTNCNKVYQSSWSLKRHMQSHSYICDVDDECSKHFTTSLQLKRHQFQEHNKEALYRCDVCQQIFSRKTDITKHLQCSHKIFYCRYKNCNYFIEEYKQLRIHMLHSHLPDLECNYCGKSYRFKSNLKKHIKLHLSLDNSVICKNKSRSIPGQYSCPDCNKVFSFISSKSRHMKLKHLTAPKVRQYKTGVHRAKRKDAGKPRRCIASVISGADISKELNETILKKKSLK